MSTKEPLQRNDISIDPIRSVKEPMKYSIDAA